MPSEPASDADGGGSPVERVAIDVAYEHVLVPLDGSPLGADVHAIAVASSNDTTESLRDEVLASIPSDPNEPRVRTVVGDDPAAAIVGHARELGSTLICMSTLGRGRLAGAVVGSVARAVLHLVDAPIVAVGPF